jgi:hypothetical protein
MVADPANVSLGAMGLLGISFTLLYQFSFLIFICSISLMAMALESEAAKKYSIRFF